MSTSLWVGPLAGMTLYVEIAWGADLTDTDGSGWTWTDVTADVRQDPGISTRLGRGDEASRSQPAQITLQLDNTDGDYSLGGQSVNWPYVRQGTPVRVRIDPDDGAGARVVFMGYADGFTPSWRALGAVPEVTLSASGLLRRLQRSTNPVTSPFTRAMGALTTLVAYWPAEDNDGASAVASGLDGGVPMIYSGTPRFGSHTEMVATARAMDAGSAAFQGVVLPYTVTASVGSQFRFLLTIPENGLADGTVLAHCHLTGTLGRIDITYELSPGPVFGVFRYNSDGTLNGSDLWNLSLVDGQTGRFSLEVRQNGTAVEWNIGWITQDPNASLANSGFQTVASKTCGIIQLVELSPHNDADGVGYGQITVENTVSNQFTDRSSLIAFYGETATGSAGRAFRVCGENDIPFERLTADTDTEPSIPTRELMAYQPVAPVLTILNECEDADLAQLWDGLQPGLVFTTRRYRESGVVALTIDAGDAELSPPFGPMHDDQRTANVATTTRKFGSTATFEDSDGPMGTAAVGRYETSSEVNTVADSMMLQHAAFRVSLGTVEGYRVPTLTVDLRVVPELAGDVLDLVPGDRVVVEDPADVLDAFPEPRVDLLVEAIAHDISATGWLVTLTCAPAAPWLASRVAAATGDTSDLVLRAESDGSTLSGNAARTATTISVATPSGPLWTTTADDFPLDLDVGGIKVHATACSGSSSPQTFTITSLELDRSSGAPVKLWDQRPLGL